ncbi:MAG: HEAT repeat domain-containing protein [Treponema sp.]|jgi:hypothetical protein|nr:HEAT repeat domain-containing protein [Treponema sp.]
MKRIAFVLIGLCLIFESLQAQESLEMLLIREQSRTQDRNTKLIALNNLRRTIMRGNTKDSVYDVLEFLGFEGLLTRSYSFGKIINDFPDVRAQVAIILRALGTERAQEMLIKLVSTEHDTTVLIEAIAGLGDTLTMNGNIAVPTMARAVRDIHLKNPNNGLALTVVQAFEKIAGRNEGALHQDGIDMVNTIASGPYFTQVRKEAEQFSQDLWRRQVQSRKW